MSSSEYWRERADERMDEYQGIADTALETLAASYADIAGYLADEARRVFNNFAIGIPETEARRLLNTIDTTDVVAQVKALLASTADPQLQQALKKQLAAPAYRARLLWLKTVQEQIVSAVKSHGQTELQVTKQGYIDTATHAYYRNTYDLQRGAGMYGFEWIKPPRIEEIVAQRWSGEHYSRRVWHNMEQLATELQRELVVGFATGKSSGKMARVMADRLGVAYQKAERLVRTETCYVANQAELESYKSSGVEQYRFLATLDRRTSELCQRQDGKVYDVKDAKAGENLPPLHPYCRSTTVPVVEGAPIGERFARDEQGKPIKLPGDMTYQQWKEQYVDKGDGSGIMVKVSKYHEAVQAFPQPNRSIIQYYAKETQYEYSASLKAPFAYSPAADKILYNHKHPGFKDFDFPVANTHELAHRIDFLNCKAKDNAAFSAAIAKANELSQGVLDHTQDYVRQNETSPFFDDIISAIFNNRVAVSAYHDTEYWEIPGHKESEIFANIFSLECFSRPDELEFIADNFCDIYEQYKKMKGAI